MEIDSAHSCVDPDRRLERADDGDGSWSTRSTPRSKPKIQPIGAYLTLCKDRAYGQAARIDELADAGDDLPPLAGVPIAVKDVFRPRKDVRTTAGRRFWRISSRRTMRPSYRVWKRPARSSWARPIATSSPWARRTRIPAFSPGAQSTRHFARARRLVGRIGGGGRGGNGGRVDSAPIPAARFASPRRSAASSD